jgi:hypothetical protein
VGVQDGRSFPADEGDDLKQGEEIVQRRDLTAQRGEGVIGDVPFAGELRRVFLGLLRRAWGHSDLYALCFKTSDQTEEYPWGAALIEPRYQL